MVHWWVLVHAGHGWHLGWDYSGGSPSPNPPTRPTPSWKIWRYLCVSMVSNLAITWPNYLAVGESVNLGLLHTWGTCSKRRAYTPCRPAYMPFRLLSAWRPQTNLLSLCRRTKDLGTVKLLLTLFRRKRLLQAPPPPLTFLGLLVECLGWSCQGAAATYFLFVSQWTKRLMGCGLRCMCLQYE
jgi:hypothetical protein